MAKDLPYFKFIATEWLTGSIVYEPFDVQGLFINICALYWQREGVLSISEVNYRFKRKALIAKLCERFISQCDGMIKIGFLDEQLIERQYVSVKNARNATEGWEKRRNKEISDPIANQCNIEEEKEQENNKNGNKVFSFKNSLIDYGFDKNLVEEWIMVRKNKKATNSQTAFNNFIAEISKKDCDLNETLKLIVTKSWSGFKWEWAEKEKQNTIGDNKFIKTFENGVTVDKRNFRDGVQFTNEGKPFYQ